MLGRGSEEAAVSLISGVFTVCIGRRVGCWEGGYAYAPMTQFLLI